MTNRQRIIQAVNYLITSPKYSRMINEITGIIEQWDTHPMTYGGDLSFLNALIDVGLSDRVAFEKLVKLIETKRKLIPEIKRVDYQRDFMAEKRARLDKAVELHELLKGKFPNGTARDAHRKVTQAKWMAERDVYVAAKGKLTWKETNAARNEFWAIIDRNLDEAIAAERAKKAR